MILQFTKHLIYLPIIFCTLFGNGQISGCTDPLAQNYSSAALQNDGSCVYATTSFSFPLINSLSVELPESSGLEFWNGKLWSHNDSGNESKLYAFDTISGNVIKEVVIRNSPQVDWEDITMDDSFFYIGDFGNNLGNRTDLKILKLSLDSITSAFSDTVTAEFIQFSYPDQTDFSGTNANHNFDCESLVFWKDSLHLFSKNYSNGYTKQYVLPINAGTYSAILIDSVFVDGQITAAAVNNDSVFLLIGYKPPLYSPFGYILWDFNQNSLFSGNKRRIQLGTVLSMGQQEGVVFSHDLSGFVASEEVLSLSQPARFFHFDLSSFIQSTLSLPEENAQTIEVSPNPFKDEFVVHIGEIAQLKEILLIDIFGKEVEFTPEIDLENNTITIFSKQLMAGNYFLITEFIDGSVFHLALVKTAL